MKSLTLRGCRDASLAHTFAQYITSFLISQLLASHAHLISILGPVLNFDCHFLNIVCKVAHDLIGGGKYLINSFMIYKTVKKSCQY